MSQDFVWAIVIAFIIEAIGLMFLCGLWRIKSSMDMFLVAMRVRDSKSKVVQSADKLAFLICTVTAVLFLSYDYLTIFDFIMPMTQPILSPFSLIVFGVAMSFIAKYTFILIYKGSSPNQIPGFRFFKHK